MVTLDWLSAPLAQRLTWTLVHFVWQGMVVAALAAACLGRWRRATARYLAGTVGLAAMGLCPVVTFLLLTPSNAVESPGGVGSAIAPGPLAGPVVGAEGDEPTSSGETSRTRDSRVLWAGVTERVRAGQPYLLVGWVLGVMLFGLRLVTAAASALGLRCHRRPLGDDLVAAVLRLGQRLGVCPGRSFLVFASERIGEALVTGFWRPVVLVPAAWVARMPPEVLQAVLAHELAHIRRFDLWVNLFERLVETLLFYHPAVWWLSRRVDREREMCCDELAAGAIGQRVAYASALEWVGRQRLRESEAGLAVALGGRNMRLLERVRYVLGLAPAGQQARWWPAGLAAALVPLVFWLAAAGADSPAQKQEPAAKEEAKPAAASVSDRIGPWDVLLIRARGALALRPIDGKYLVEPDGCVLLSDPYGRVPVKGLLPEEAERVTLRRLKEIGLRNPEVDLSVAGHVTRLRSAVLRPGPYRIQPGDSLLIDAFGVLPLSPIEGTYRVEPSGHVALGSPYGRVLLKGLSVEQAEKAIVERLKALSLRNPNVSVTPTGWKTTWRDVSGLQGPYRIAPGDLLKVEADGVLPQCPIGGTFVVQSDGSVGLRTPYGRVALQGLTLEQAGRKIEEHLKKVNLRHPEVDVSLAGWETDEKDKDNDKESNAPFVAPRG